jgi:hypothetical protein
MIESYPVQQSLGMNRPMEFAGGAFQNTTLKLHRVDTHLENLHLGASWYPMVATFIRNQASRQPPHYLPSSHTLCRSLSKIECNTPPTHHRGSHVDVAGQARDCMPGWSTSLSPRRLANQVHHLQTSAAATQPRRPPPPRSTRVAAQDPRPT